MSSNLTTVVCPSVVISPRPGNRRGDNMETSGENAEN
jgi:hypothetical protein